MSFLVSPLVALIVAGVVLAFARRRWLRAIGVVGLLAGWAGSTSVVANALVSSIEAHAGDDASQCDGLEAVVLLAGGLQWPPRNARDVAALSIESQLRTMALAERDDPALPLYIAGGGPYEVRESELMREFMQRIAPRRAVAGIETASLTTWENATGIARVLPPPRRIALATSALHLPRARRAFEAAGFTVCPWPLNRYGTTFRAWWMWFPNVSAVRRTEAWMHEVAGDWVYAWRSED